VDPLQSFEKLVILQIDHLNFPTVICCCKESTLVVHSHLIDLLTVEAVSVERTGRGALHNARGMLTL
jgi:hypothetical protein